MRSSRLSGCPVSTNRALAASSGRSSAEGSSRCTTLQARACRVSQRGRAAGTAPSPAGACRRCRISCAARRVKVTASSCEAGTSWASRYCRRPTSTRVLPAPGPASTSTGVPVSSPAVRASACAGEKPPSVRPSGVAGSGSLSAGAALSCLRRTRMAATVTAVSCSGACGAGSATFLGRPRLRGAAPSSRLRLRVDPCHSAASSGLKTRTTPYSPS